jgi:outer membrane cobalamin receptor
MVGALVLASGFSPEVVSGDGTTDQVDYQLETIVVTATRTPQALRKSDADVTVITDADIRQSFAQHLGEALKGVPGINVGEYGGTGQNVSVGIRGSTAGQVLIMVDGVPVNDPQLGGLDLNLIALDDVERVEVVRGSSSALYGADAMGGVVNIITKTTTYEKPRSDVTYQQGNHGFEKIGGQFCRRLGRNLGLNLTGSSTKYDGYRENSDYRGRHLGVRITFSPRGDSHIAYSTRFYQGDLGVPGMITLPTPSSRQEDRSWAHTLTLQVRPGEGHDVQAVLY